MILMIGVRMILIKLKIHNIAAVDLLIFISYSYVAQIANLRYHIRAIWLRI